MFLCIRTSRHTCTRARGTARGTLLVSSLLARVLWKTRCMSSLQRYWYLSRADWSTLQAGRQAAKRRTGKIRSLIVLFYGTCWYGVPPLVLSRSRPKFSWVRTVGVQYASTVRLMNLLAAALMLVVFLLGTLPGTSTLPMLLVQFTLCLLLGRRSSAPTHAPCW